MDSLTTSVLTDAFCVVSDMKRRGTQFVAGLEWRRVIGGAADDIGAVFDFWVEALERVVDASCGQVPDR